MSESMLDAVSSPLRAEAVRLLQELIRVNTVNPPGNETAAAELLRAYLEENGVACELAAIPPVRTSLPAFRARARAAAVAPLAHGHGARRPVRWTVGPGQGSCGTAASGAAAPWT